MRKKSRELLLFLIFTFLVSIGYLVWTWPNTPYEVIHDMQRLGPIGFTLDLIFAILLFRWLKNKREED